MIDVRWRQRNPRREKLFTNKTLAVQKRLNLLQFSVSLSGDFVVCDDHESLLPRLGALAVRLAQ